jgi:CHAT domain-containing protein
LRLKRLDALDVIYRAHAVLARSAYRAGDVPAALDHYDAVVATLRAPTAELAYDQRAQFLEDKDTLYLEALAVALEAGDPLRALTYLEQGRARSAWTAATTGDEELDGLRARHRYISGSLITLAASSPMLTGARQELRRLERRIRDVVEARAERIAVLAPLDQATLLRSLPETTTLAYALVQDDVIVFVSAHGQVTAERVAGGARQVRSLERVLRLHMDALPYWLATFGHEAQSAELASREASVQKALRGLWALLIAPVAAQLPPDGEPLTLVPHGLLHTLPLAAMHDGERYAIERWQLACAASCRALSRDTADLVTPGDSLLAFGYSRDGSLPNASEEARQVAAQVGGEARVDAEATGDCLRQEAAGRGYLHLAAHAALRPDSPNSSFVELADGPFHPSDALTLDLRGCRLVTLSACQTGLGRQSGGDEQIGLLRAFGLAGAEAVLATLWRVDDPATFAFMRQLYQRISGGAHPAEALRAAQLFFIHGTDEPSRHHPYFWAGFQLAHYRAHVDEPALAVVGQQRAAGVSESLPA